MGLQKYPLGGFLGGMNLVDNPYALSNNEAQIALNVDLGIRGVLSSRKGFSEGGLAGVSGSVSKLPKTGESIPAAFESPFASWTNPENIKLKDGVYATTNLSNVKPAVHNQLAIIRGKKYEAVLPASAQVRGIKVTYKAVIKNEVPSVVPITLWQNLREGETLLAERAEKVFTLGPNEERAVEESVGGEADMWGLGALTKAQVESAGFAAELEGIMFTGAFTVKVDWIEITIYYFVPGVGADIINHMRPWYTGANRYLMVSANGKIKRLKEGTLTTLFTGTAGTTWYFEPIEYQAGNEEILLCMNGVDVPKFINQAGEVKEWKGATKIVPKGTMGRVWKGRMMIAGVAAHPQRLYESEPFNPFTPDDETNGGYGTNFVDIGTGEDDVDPITWLEVIDDVLIVFKKKSTWAIYTDNGLANYRIANVGCEGRFLSCVSDDRCYFANRAGIYSVTAEGSPRYESVNVEPIFKGEHTDLWGGGGPGGGGNSEFEGMNLEKLGSQGRMVSLPNGRVYLAFTPNGTSEVNEFMLELYPRLRSSSEKGDERTPVVIHNFVLRGINAMCTYRLNDKEVDKIVAGLVLQNNTSPQLVRLFYSENDGAIPVLWRWVSGKKPEVSEEPFERIRRVNILMTGRVRAKMFSDTQSLGPVILETTKGKEEMVRFRPETWGRYHWLELEEADEGGSASIYAVELAFRGGKEHT